MSAKDSILKLINTYNSDSPFLLAIDGRCASGKTTIANELAGILHCNLIHMDDFYLPLNQRTPERMALPGGNIDFERLINEVISPIKSGTSALYRPYDCHKDYYYSPKHLDIRKNSILEGSYSCHPFLGEFLDLKVFYDISPATQIERISKRNPDTLEMFLSTWIPREEVYFDTYNIRNLCDLILM